MILRSGRRSQGLGTAGATIRYMIAKEHSTTVPFGPFFCPAVSPLFFLLRGGVVKKRGVPGCSVRKQSDGEFVHSNPGLDVPKTSITVPSSDVTTRI